MNLVIEKVCAFITREGAASKELLVFEHEDYPTAGIQIPAGTVELGEPLEKALLREIQEETGLTELRIVSHLGTLNFDLPLLTSYHALAQATELLREPVAGAAPVDLPGGYGTLLRRGWWVDLVEESAGWARVTYAEGEQKVSGWIETELLAERLVRHLYHLIPIEGTADRWNIFAEGRYTFCLYWLPLRPRPHIHPTQDPWLDHVYERLL